MAVEGKRKSKVPFPQFDYPGSKISPFTGKPYTKDEAASVHSKSRVAQARKLSKSNANKQYNQAAIERRLEKMAGKKKGAVAVPPPKFITDFVKAAKPRDSVKPPGLPKWLKPNGQAKKHAGWEALEEKKKSQPKRSTSTRGGHRA